jgi:hypothetical protein
VAVSGAQAHASSWASSSRSLIWWPIALLQVLLDLRVLVVHLQADLVAAADHARPETPRGGGDHLAGKDDGDVVGTAEDELIGEHALEPGTAAAGGLKTRVPESSSWRSASW